MAAAILLLIAFYLVFESRGALSRIGLARFFSDASWHPAPAAADGLYNLVPMLVGTALCMVGAILLAGPLGICSAVFCQYYAPRPVARTYRHLVSLLAGIPSVVYGFWGLVVLVPLVRLVVPPGPSLIAGILILAVMILPTVALIAESALEAVPESYLQGASALGLTRFATVVGVALPAARSGLIAATMLGASRALGETMAILMVSGNIVAVPESLFDPVRTLTANIALEMAYALGDHRSSLFVTGLVLLAMIIAMIAGTDRLSRSATRV
jgi:phosphate transport system permease protein